MAFLSNRLQFTKQMLNKRYPNQRPNTVCCSGLLTPKFSSTDSVSDSTLLMQDGRVIQELPLVVQRVSFHKAAQILIHGKIKCNDQSNFDYITDPVEIQEIISGFQKCNSLMDIYKLLETMPPNYIQPTVAYEVLKKLIEIESVQSAFIEANSSDETNSTFMRPVIISLMMKVILNDKQGDMLISCLRSLNQKKYFRKYVESFLPQIHEQIMLNVTQNKFNLDQICDLAKELNALGHFKDVDKLWIGIIDNVNNTTKENVLKLYQTLPYFQSSRNVIANALLNKLKTLWYTMEGRDVAEILIITKNTFTYSPELLQIFGQWLSSKIDKMSEDDLLIVINGFSNVDFVDTNVTSALELYIKVHGLEVTNPCLFAVIMDYCLKFRIRSAIILEKACDYFIMRKSCLPPVVVKSLVVPFGYLNFVPLRSYEFWKTFEDVFEEKFAYFNAEHVLDILMSCLYLEKYPINFVNHLFDPYFLNRLQSDCDNWLATKKKLILFDHIMTSECKSYKGPMLLRELPISLTISDMRIRFIIMKIRELLVDIIGSADRVILNKCLHTCPTQNICTVDVFLVPEDAEMPYLGNFAEAKNPFYALLFHVPEHYTFEETNLIGPQVLRKRHLEKLGVAVVDLNYSHLLNLCSNRGMLTKYLQDKLQDAKSQYYANRTRNSVA